MQFWRGSWNPPYVNQIGLEFFSHVYIPSARIKSSSPVLAPLVPCSVCPLMVCRQSVGVFFLFSANFES